MHGIILSMLLLLHCPYSSLPCFPPLPVEARLLYHVSAPSTAVLLPCPCPLLDVSHLHVDSAAVVPMVVVAVGIQALLPTPPDF